MNDQLKKIEKWWSKEISYKIIFGVVLLFIVILRFYKITELPYGINVDEAGMGYDAFSLANYHVDRYLTRFPVYLRNFGGGQSALYAYMCAIFIKFFTHGKLTLFAMRFPAALLGICTILFGTMTAKKVFGKNQAILCELLFGILPYYFMQARFGLDCNLMLGFSTISFFCLICAIEKQKNYFFVITGILWGITLYTYALSYIMIMLFLACISFYLLFQKKIKFLQLISMATATFLVALPLVLFIYINTFHLPSIQTPLFTIPFLDGYRVSEMSFSNVLPNIKRCFDSLFFKDELDYNAFDQYYTLYSISIPFAVLGMGICLYRFFTSIRNKRFSYDSFIVIFFLCVVITGSLIGELGPNTNNLNAAFLPLAFFITCGISYTCNKMGTWRWQTFILIFSVYGVCFVSFLHYYFIDYKREIYPQDMFEVVASDELRFLKNQKVTGNIYIDYYNEGYIFYLIDQQPSPYEFDISNVGNADNVFFYYPGMAETENCYIVKKCSEYNLKTIQESGIMFNVYETDEYFVFY